MRSNIFGSKKKINLKIFKQIGTRHLKIFKQIGTRHLKIFKQIGTRRMKSPIARAFLLTKIKKNFTYTDGNGKACAANAQLILLITCHASNVGF